MFSLNSVAGHSVKDDMLIILGVRGGHMDAAKAKTEVKDAVMKLLQDELGLEVLMVEPQVKKIDEWICRLLLMQIQFYLKQ